MVKWTQIWMLLTALCLMACDTEKTSGVKIVGGQIVKLSLDKDANEMPHVIGLGFGRRFTKKSISEGEVCSGFRYGLRYIITSAQCMRKQIRNDGHFEQVDVDYTNVPNGARGKIFPIEFLLMSGTGGVIQSDGNVFFHPAFAQKCAEKLECPDIAIVELPKDVVLSEEYNAITDPAIYDTRTGYDSDMVIFAVAGFGCTRNGNVSIDMFNPENCSRVGEDFWDSTFHSTGFANYSFSVAAGVLMSPMNEGKIKPYYYRLSHNNNKLQLTSGDSGAPIFRQSFSNDKLRPGDPFTYIVDAIGVSLYYSDYKAYGSFALDLGHDEIKGWVRQVTKNDGALLEKPPVTPPVSADDADEDDGITLQMCNPRLLNPETTVELGMAMDLSATHLGSTIDAKLKARLDEIDNKGMAHHLATCISIIRHEINKVKKFAVPAQGMEAAEARLAFMEYAEYNALFILESTLEWQELLKAKQAAEAEAVAAMRKAAEEELFTIVMTFVDVGTDFIPGVDVAKTLFTVATGRSAIPPFEEVSDAERGIAAATILLPGALKAAKKGLDHVGDAAKGVGRGARIAARITEYQSKVSALSAKMAKVGNKIRRAPEKMATVFYKAKELGFKTPQAVRRFLMIGKSLTRSCDIVDDFVHAQPAPWHGMHRVLDFLMPTAYAAEPDVAACAKIAGDLITKVQKHKPNIDLDELETLVQKGKKVGIDDVDEIERAILGGATTERAFKGFKALTKDMEEKILYGKRNLPGNELIGAHSPRIQNHPLYDVQYLRTNQDGTKYVKVIHQFPDGKLSKLKNSTLFPDSWSDDKILEATRDISQNPAIGVRGVETYHIGEVDGFVIGVMKEGDQVTASFPTGGSRDVFAGYTPTGNAQ